MSLHYYQQICTVLYVDGDMTLRVSQSDGAVTAILRAARTILIEDGRVPAIRFIRHNLDSAEDGESISIRAARMIMEAVGDDAQWEMHV